MDIQVIAMRAIEAVDAVDAVVDPVPYSPIRLEPSLEAVRYAVEDLWLRIAQVCTVVVEWQGGTANTLDLKAVGLTAGLTARLTAGLVPELHRCATDPATYCWANDASRGTLATVLRSGLDGVHVQLKCPSAGTCGAEDATSWALDFRRRLQAAQLRARRPAGSAM